jgi:hypothetical protein
LISPGATAFVLAVIASLVLRTARHEPIQNHAGAVRNPNVTAACFDAACDAFRIRLVEPAAVFGENALFQSKLRLKIMEFSNASDRDLSDRVLSYSPGNPIWTFVRAC